MSTERSLHDEDALELGELMEFLESFLADEADTIEPALGRSCAGGYSITELRADLARFAFLLGGDGAAFVFGDEG